jgi:hypothetical protein
MSDSPMAGHFPPSTKILHRPLGFKQSYAAIVKDISVLISRILVVPRLKRVWSVNQIKIQILEPQSIQTRLESRFDALKPMIVVPQLCGNKDAFTPNPSSGKSCLQAFTYFTLIPISFRTIEVSKSSFQGVSGRTIVAAASGIRVPKPSTGIWPAPWLSGVLVVRKSDDSIKRTPR